MAANETEWDCVVVGGGAAGLSAALVLGRARRRTLLVDMGNQSNLAGDNTTGGLLGHDGQSPAKLYETGRTEIAEYPSVQFRHGEVVRAASVEAGGFALELGDGGVADTRLVLLATGMDYVTPQIPGLADIWGKSAFHCPFCDGWEMRDRPLAVLAQGDRAVHSALMLRGWTDDVVVLTNGSAGFDDRDLALLTAAGVTVDERPVIEFQSQAGELTAVAFAEGERMVRRGVLVETTLRQRSTLASQLGVTTAPSPIAFDAIQIDPFQRTSVTGVFSAGDVSAQMPQVAAAIATGSLAASAVVQTLLADDLGLPVPPWPEQTN